MNEHSITVQREVGTREEWLAARLTLLEAEKEHTRRGDELALMRRELPWVNRMDLFECAYSGTSTALGDADSGRFTR